jgi:hypothetical protein
MTAGLWLQNAPFRPIKPLSRPTASGWEAYGKTAAAAGPDSLRHSAPRCATIRRRFSLTLRRNSTTPGGAREKWCRAPAAAPCLHLVRVILFKDLSKWGKAEILRMAENPDEWLVSGHPVYLVR